MENQVQINHGVKSQLAKLLATENIIIQHDSQAKTASFDTKNRILSLPVWKKITEDLMDMLIIHEVGHAIDTPAEDWIKAAIDIGQKHYPNNPTMGAAAAKGFLNVIEDARIDKRQKRRYPGSKINYLNGYKTLADMDFFGVKNKEINLLPFIDRVNIYFKGGFNSNIKFTPEELKYLNRIKNIETFEEVKIITDEIFAFSKDQQIQDNHLMEDELIDEFDDNFEFDQDESDDGDSVSDGDDQDESDDGDSVSDGDDQDESDDQNEKETNNISSGGDQESIPKAQTDEYFQNKQHELNEQSAAEFKYADIPTPVIGNIVDDYKKVMKEYEALAASYSEFVLPSLKNEFMKFKIDENSTISFMVKEFEMKKAADEYKRTFIGKTGMLDFDKIHSYKYRDDIFRRLNVVAEGKNHGFVMFIDWSQSMQSEVLNTLKQLYSMILFCKRIQIPFDVYLFKSTDKYPDEQFNGTDIRFVRGFTLRNIFSSKMKIKELNDMMMFMYCTANLFGIASHKNPYINTSTGWSIRSNHPDKMSSTPLNQTIIAAKDIVTRFKNENACDIVNTIFLTDGESDPLHMINIPNSKNINLILRDTKTKNQYIADYGGISKTTVLLQNLKDTTGCNLIGFYIFNGHIRNINHFYNYDLKYNRLLRKQILTDLKTNKFIALENKGYDDYYLVKMSDLEMENNLNVNSDMTKSQLKKAFQKYTIGKSINRVLLTRFIDKVAQ